jgi:hypothetical protein
MLKDFIKIVIEATKLRIIILPADFADDGEKRQIKLFLF